MTVPEIQALRTELEDALLQCFTDFERLSGMTIESINLSHVCYFSLHHTHPITADRHLTAVKVNLEPI